MRLVLYVSRGSYDRLRVVAGRRTQASGLEVTAEATARALLYAGLGLGADGEDRYPITSVVEPAPELLDEPHPPIPRGHGAGRPLVKLPMSGSAPTPPTELRASFGREVWSPAPSAPQGGGGLARPNDAPDRAYTGMLCVECREPQYETSGGETCANGHDGAGSMDPPTYDIERRVRS